MVGPGAADVGDPDGLPDCGEEPAELVVVYGAVVHLAGVPVAVGDEEHGWVELAQPVGRAVGGVLL